MTDKPPATFLRDYPTFERHLGVEVGEVKPGHAVLFIDIEAFHLNGNGTLHGGVYAALIDNAMGFAVAALAQVRVATTQMNLQCKSCPHMPVIENQRR